MNMPQLKVKVAISRIYLWGSRIYAVDFEGTNWKFYY